MTAHRYGVFGFRLHCARALWGLAGADGLPQHAPDLHLGVDCALKREPLPDGAQTRSFREDGGLLEGRLSLVRRGGGAYRWYADAPPLPYSRIDCDPAAGTIWMRRDGPYRPLEFASFLISPVMPHWVRVTSRNLALHATVIGVGDRAVAIAGASGRGKTTLAMAFRRRGFAILADDLAVIDPASGLVHHGAAFLRTDGRTVASVLDGEAPLRRLPAGKELLDVSDHPYWRAPKPLPLSAIYVLDEFSDDDRVWARELGQPLAGLTLNAHLSGQIFKPDDRTQKAGLAAAIAVSQTVPVRSLVRPKGLEHLDAAVDLACAQTVAGRAACAPAGRAQASPAGLG